MFCVYILLSVVFFPFRSQFNTTRKKLAIVCWSDPYGPEIYSKLKIRFSKALSMLERIKQTTGKHVTTTHLVCKAAAEVLKKFPKLNGKISFGNFVPYESVDVSCLVALDSGSDLGYLCYREADKKSLINIAEEADNRFTSVRSGKERNDYKKASSPFNFIPTCGGGIIIEVISFISVSLGISLPMFGVTKHAMGSVVITNIGMLGGSEVVYGPLPPMAKCPALIVVTNIKDEIFVNNGELFIDKGLTMCITLDHRFVNGVEASKAQNLLKRILEDPESFITLE